MRKRLVAILAIVMLLCLSACGVQNRMPDVSTDSEAGQQPTPSTEKETDMNENDNETIKKNYCL